MEEISDKEREKPPNKKKIKEGVRERRKCERECLQWHHAIYLSLGPTKRVGYC
ncbi:hypothetical protein SESBI_36403 [Sesbania bispinosa]|nr:hypothetical protein SESBI_36403 [Sesbania bispinosa]